MKPFYAEFEISDRIMISGFLRNSVPITFLR